MQIRFPLSDLFGDFQYVMVVDTRNHDSVDFDCDIMGFEVTHSLQLPIDQQLCCRSTMKFFTAELYSGINPGSDKRIDRIGSNGDKSDAEFGECRDMFRQSESIGRKADMQERIFPADMFNRHERSLRVGKGITGPGDAGNRNPWHMIEHRIEICQRLFRFKYSAGNPWSAFI